MLKKKTTKFNFPIIAVNRSANYEYFIKEEFEAGIILQGWEVKSLRSGKANISNSHVVLKNGEAFLFGANFSPLTITSSHYRCNPMRTRKLLLNHFELDSLYGRINRNDYTIIAISLFWKNVWCKVNIGIVKGKKQHDKRTNLKETEWQIDKTRIMKNKSKGNY